MRNVIRVLFVCFLAVLSMQSFGQKIGLQGGINLAKMLDKDDDGTYSDEYDMNLGFNAGVTFEMGFGSLFSLETGLIADTKGLKWEEAGSTTKVNLLYLDVPVLIKVGPSFGPLKVFAAAGPYVGFGLTGKFKGEDESVDVSWGDDPEENEFKRMDYGAKLGIGAEVSKFTLGAYYALGLANISPYTEGGTKLQNRVISISVGYKF